MPDDTMYLVIQGNRMATMHTHLHALRHARKHWTVAIGIFGIGICQFRLLFCVEGV